MSNHNEHRVPSFDSRPRGFFVPKSIPPYPLHESILGPPWERGLATSISNSTSSKPSPLDADRVCCWQHKSQLTQPDVEWNALSPSHGESIKSLGLDECTKRRGLNKQWQNGLSDCSPLHFKILPANDDTAHGFWPTKKYQQPVTHYQSYFPSWIDYLAAGHNSNLINTLINLQKCNEDRLKDFYRSAFERLDPNASANILKLWLMAMESEVWLRIKQRYSKELECHDSRDNLYHLLCGNHGEKLPFRQLLEALRFVKIKKIDREGVEMRILLREIEIWKKSGQ